MISCTRACGDGRGIGVDSTAPGATRGGIGAHSTARWAAGCRSTQKRGRAFANSPFKQQRHSTAESLPTGQCKPPASVSPHLQVALLLSNLLQVSARDQDLICEGKAILQQAAGAPRAHPRSGEGQRAARAARRPCALGSQVVDSDEGNAAVAAHSDEGSTIRQRHHASDRPCVADQLNVVSCRRQAVCAQGTSAVWGHEPGSGCSCRGLCRRWGAAAANGGREDGRAV